MRYSVDSLKTADVLRGRSRQRRSGSADRAGAGAAPLLHATDGCSTLPRGRDGVESKGGPEGGDKIAIVLIASHQDRRAHSKDGNGKALIPNRAERPFSCRMDNVRRPAIYFRAHN